MADDGRFEIEEGREIVGRTIVGGRPRARLKRKVSIPIGIEKVLVRAAGDEAFHRALFADREQALSNAGYDLLGSERSILRSVPDAALASMVANIDLKAHTKRRFARGVAKVAFATAAMTAMVTAGAACTGAEPDEPSQDAAEETVDAASIEVEETMTSRGILPDIPPTPGTE